MDKLAAIFLHSPNVFVNNCTNITHYTYGTEWTYCLTENGYDNLTVNDTYKGIEVKCDEVGFYMRTNWKFYNLDDAEIGSGLPITLHLYCNPDKVIHKLKLQIPACKCWGYIRCLAVITNGTWVLYKDPILERLLPIELYNIIVGAMTSELCSAVVPSIFNTAPYTDDGGEWDRALVYINTKADINAICRFALATLESSPRIEINALETIFKGYKSYKAIEDQKGLDASTRLTTTGYAEIRSLVDVNKIHAVLVTLKEQESTNDDERTRIRFGNKTIIDCIQYTDNVIGVIQLIDDFYSNAANKLDECDYIRDLCHVLDTYKTQTNALNITGTGTAESIILSHILTQAKETVRYKIEELTTVATMYRDFFLNTNHNLYSETEFNYANLLNIMKETHQHGNHTTTTLYNVITTFGKKCCQKITYPFSAKNLTDIRSLSASELYERLCTINAAQMGAGEEDFIYSIRLSCVILAHFYSARTIWNNKFDTYLCLNHCQSIHDTVIGEYKLTERTADREKATLELTDIYTNMKWFMKYKRNKSKSVQYCQYLFSTYATFFDTDQIGIYNQHKKLPPLADILILGRSLMLGNNEEQYSKTFNELFDVQVINIWEKLIPTHWDWTNAAYSSHFKPLIETGCRLNDTAVIQPFYIPQVCTSDSGAVTIDSEIGLTMWCDNTSQNIEFKNHPLQKCNFNFTFDQPLYRSCPTYPFLSGINKGFTKLIGQYLKNINKVAKIVENYFCDIAQMLEGTLHNEHPYVAHLDNLAAIIRKVSPKNHSKLTGQTMLISILEHMFVYWRAYLPQNEHRPHSALSQLLTHLTDTSDRGQTDFTNLLGLMYACRSHIAIHPIGSDIDLNTGENKWSACVSDELVDLLYTKCTSQDRKCNLGNSINDIFREIIKPMKTNFSGKRRDKTTTSNIHVTNNETFDFNNSKLDKHHGIVRHDMNELLLGTSILIAIDVLRHCYDDQSIVIRSIVPWLLTGMNTWALTTSGWETTPTATDRHLFKSGTGNFIDFLLNFILVHTPFNDLIYNIKTVDDGQVINDPYLNIEFVTNALDELITSYKMDIYVYVGRLQNTTKNSEQETLYEKIKPPINNKGGDGMTHYMTITKSKPDKLSSDELTNICMWIRKNATVVKTVGLTFFVNLYNNALCTQWEKYMMSKTPLDIQTLYIYPQTETDMCYKALMNNYSPTAVGVRTYENFLGKFIPHTQTKWIDFLSADVSLQILPPEPLCLEPFQSLSIADEPLISPTETHFLPQISASAPVIQRVIDVDVVNDTTTNILSDSDDDDADDDVDVDDVTYSSPDDDYDIPIKSAEKPRDRVINIPSNSFYSDVMTVELETNNLDGHLRLYNCLTDMISDD